MNLQDNLGGGGGFVEENNMKKCAKYGLTWTNPWTILTEERNSVLQKC